ncbi:MAG: two-component system response regulator [Planctomycetes bacterium]|jgi:CheY-like chemotaxis protein|nr:two-component system response regulator [Planctomycetota bacterium]
MERTILIIEDEKLIIVSTQMVLEAVGYRVESAMNGEEGIQKAKDLNPDLILLDIMMPGIDGWETLTRLKRDQGTAGTPVIIFTAREHARGHQKSNEMGAAGYFRKPFEPDELIDLVEKHVGQSAKA